MRFLTSLVLLLSATIALAQDELQILKPGKGKSGPDRMLYNYLLGEVQKRLDTRRKEIAAIKTPEDFKKRQARIKAKFIDALGGFPKKTPLKARVVGKMHKEDYHIEKVIYDSRPEHHVTAILYLPKGKGPFPGVLVPCGHSSNGKAAEAYQRVCILMAKNGMAVLCYDPIGQGERHQLLNKSGKPAIPSSTSEHTMVGVGALLVGKNVATYRIWDGIRSMDYLASRPEVDARRLGCTGNSGGGTLTAYLMALDDRIVAAAPSCYITSLERMFETIGPQDGEQNITGQVAFGMDHADYLTLRAPKATKMLVATRDFFDIDGAWKTFREAKLLYGLLGYGERVSLFEYNDTHGFSKPRRQAAARWMSRWLLKKDRPIFEPEFDVFTDAQLQCTRSGQVLADLHGKSAFDLNAAREKQLAKKRKQWLGKQAPNDFRKKIRELLAVPKRAGKLQAKKLGVVERNGYSITRVLTTTEDNIHLPVWLFTPKEAKPLPISLVIYVSDKGTKADAQVGGSIEELVKKGKIVVGVDLRGWGETAPIKKGGLTTYFGKEWQESFLALHLNRPLLGQRVQDLLATVAFVRMSDGKQPIHIIAKGSAGPVALHAAALDPHIKSVTVENSIRSWADVVHTPMSKNHLANAVPGVLAWYDLPDLERLIGRQRVTIRTPVDAAGNKLAPPPGK